MRPLAILATVLTCAAASSAGAQTLTGQAPLNLQVQPTAQGDEIGALALLNGAAFAPRTASDDVDPISRLIEREGYQPHAGLERWTSGEVRISPTTHSGA